MPIKDLTMKMSVKLPNIRLTILGWFMILLVGLRIIKPDKAAEWMEQWLRKRMKFRIGNGEWKTFENKEEY